MDLTQIFLLFIVFFSLLLPFLPIFSDNPSLLSLTPVQQNVIFSLTNIAENSQTNFDYNYAENIHDGRGVTFGIIGFTSGTYDGTELIEKVKSLDPNNKLDSYLSAFEAIDKLPHHNGKTDNTKGLENFIRDFNSHGVDVKVKEAQLDKLKELYWNPAWEKAVEIGAKHALTIAQLYDICVNHGADGDSHDKGLKQLVEETVDAVGIIGNTDEKTWLNKLYDVRYNYMKSDPTWREALDRVDMHRRVFKTGNMDLKTPLHVTCYGDSFTINGDAL